MWAVHRPHPAAEPTTVPPPSSARPVPVPPKAPVPAVGIVDKAFIDALTQSGVPVPSHDYATTHGHAVCDFLSRQPNFAEAVQYVQGSTIWDANQSTNFTAGAIVSYCPQYESGEHGRDAAGLPEGALRPAGRRRQVEGHRGRPAGDRRRLAEPSRPPVSLVVATAGFSQSAPEGIRTPNLLIRSQNSLVSGGSTVSRHVWTNPSDLRNRLAVSRRDAGRITPVVTIA